MTRSRGKVDIVKEDKKRAENLKRKADEIRRKEEEEISNDPDFVQGDSEEEDTPPLKQAKKGRPTGRANPPQEVPAVFIRYDILPQEHDAHPLNFLHDKMDSTALKNVCEFSGNNHDEIKVCCLFFQ